ncbi:hypothetical protein ASG43_02020 [Aureimonas sp. Leaf454]|uniref:ATP-binding protein n=1 Tax=Aureimonas sp. Leaf454 TaxID=1736381 RepID=UPI0006F6D4E3|nr:ATP-binding protein [Aureimonas sp. Leaf454]KQT54404.1 hypothetical protein ASG43_02020 [Aureimonas sp. Leaf454]
MTPELAKGEDIVRKSARATWALIACSLLLLALLAAAYANLWIRQTDLRDGIREDALWAVYQVSREARTLKETIAAAERQDRMTQADRDGLLLRFDILYSRMSILETTEYGSYFSVDTSIDVVRTRLRDLIKGLEPEFDRLRDALADMSQIASIERSTADLVAVSEDLLLRTNSALSAARADSRAEVMHLQTITAWIVLALAVSAALLIVSLVRRLRATREAGEQIRIVAGQMSAAFEAAEAGNRAKSEFMATMGHEIRTPLNAILGMAELLSLSDLGSEDADSVRAIGASGTALLEIINEILDFAKIEHGDESPERIAFDPIDVARQSIGIVEGRARERGNVLQFTDVGIEGFYLGDPTRLRRVLLNLLSNAVKFTENGHVRLAIREVGDENALRLRFVVSDTGIGIPETSRHLLFQAFSQVDGTIGRRFGGTGLGLAICKRVVEAMGGTIGVDSEPGMGSRFWFEVPALRTSSLPIGAPEDAGDAENLPGLDILVVEDNAFNRAVAGRLLAALGQRVVFAEDGEAAVSMSGERRYDLVLMDMQMPVMDGVEATRRIRRPGNPNGATPIVALTANASEADRRRCMEIGMSDFEPKPVSMARLRSLIVKWAPDAAEEGARPSSRQSAAPGPEAAAVPRAPEVPAEAVSRDVADVDEARVADLIAAIGEEGLDELQDAFLEDAGLLLAELADAMRRNDGVLTDRVLHTIKGAASNVGYGAIAELAERLRTSPRDGCAHETISAGLRRLSAGRSRTGETA